MRAAKKVFVSGCFDLLHSGHIAFLEEAAKHGDVYVGIGSDDTIRRLKGRYPVYSQDAVITVSIEPTVEFNDRSGMATSTRKRAIELWHAHIPEGDREKLARMLFCYENPPGTDTVSGSQDALGIVLPGVNKLQYDGGYWPENIVSVREESILSWLEEHLCLLTLGPRRSEYTVVDNTNITPENAARLALAADRSWEAILRRDVKEFGRWLRESFHAQVAMFPNMLSADIREVVAAYDGIVHGLKLSGAGGGGYLVLVADRKIDHTMEIHIRR